MAEDTFSFLLTQVSRALEPLGNAVASPAAVSQFIATLGWELPPAVQDIGLAGTDVTALANAALTLARSTDGEWSDPVLIGERVANVVLELGKLIQALTTVMNELSSQTGLPSDYLAKTQMNTELVPRLLDFLIIAFLERYYFLAYQLLRLVGVISVEPVAADSASYQTAHLRRTLDFDRLNALLSPQGSWAQQVYGWGTPQQDISTLMRNISGVLIALGASPVATPLAQVLEEAVTGQPAPQAATDPMPSVAVTLLQGIAPDTYRMGVILFEMRPSTSTSTDAGLGILPFIYGTAELTLPLPTSSGLWSVVIDADVDLSGGVVLSWRPNNSVRAQTGVFGTAAAPLTSGSVGLFLQYAGTGQDVTLFTLPGGTRFSLRSFKAGGGARLVADSGIDAFGEIDLQGAKLTLSLGGADSFIGSLIGAGPLVVNAQLSVAYSQQRGLSLNGSAGLGTTVPVGARIGPLLIDTLYLAASVSATGLAIEGSVDASAAIGPVGVSVHRIGTNLNLYFRNGNLGPADFEFGFKAPDGAGLALQAPPVSGVGFLAFDVADGRYLGAIALTVGDVGISAVGVLDTKLPGGATGYSLIVVASAQFPPVELGFGFSLSAIGGLVGLHRTANVPTLQALARAGRLDDLMFPADLVHRAPQVAANLAQQFPVAQGHFIVGPAVQIQWGAGGMVYADIGVFIELSDSGGGVTVLRIALLGLVHLTLPDGAAPVADITLDVLGVLDFAAKTLSLDAGLRNSTIATYPLTGQAALRAGWGSDPAFLFALGGFNPCFQAPAGFPALQRITLSIGGDNPRLRLSAYLALTSNTLQLGCAADLYASANVSGVTAAVAASLAFDALVQFKPFGLIVDLTITAAILVNNNPILTLSLDLHVTGPDPWTVHGSASFGFLWFTITVPISITAGPPPLPQAPQTVDLDGNLTTALADPHSWATGPPPGRGLVRVRGQGAAGTAMHPLGTLTVRQHAAPLGQRIERYGPDLLDVPCRYDITGTDLGGQPVSATAVTDYFAPAQFLTMSDADKLSAPSFEMMTAGTTIGSAGLTLPATPGSGQAPATVVDTVSTAAWDTLILDSPDPAPPAPAQAASAQPASGARPAVIATPGSTSVPDALLTAQLGGAAAALAGPAGQPQVIYASPGIGIAVQQPDYVIAGLDLAAPATAAAITNWHLPSLTAGLTTAAQAGYQHNWQVVYTSEVA